MTRDGPPPWLEAAPAASDLRRPPRPVRGVFEVVARFWAEAREPAPLARVVDEFDLLATMRSHLSDSLLTTSVDSARRLRRGRAADCNCPAVESWYDEA